MTLQTVVTRLDALLATLEPRALLLTGGWGTGKTYQWRRALHRAATARGTPRYAYVSLFGLASLAELRKRLAEEMAAATKPDGMSESIGSALNKWKLNWWQVGKILPILPWIGKLESLANELSFLAVQDAVICLDDLERVGKGLEIRDVLGLVSFLKDQRNCRVLLISDYKKLPGEGQDELTRHLEKVVDESVDLAPTPAEACDIALGVAGSGATAVLREMVCTLSVSNVRLISRLHRMTDDLAPIMHGLHAEILRESIQSLVLFGACHLLAADGFPPVERVINVDQLWAMHRRNGQSAEDARWSDLLERYGYISTSEVDREIARSMQRGFFEPTVLRPLAEQASEIAATRAAIERFHDTWGAFWNSLKPADEQTLAALRDLTIGAIPYIGPGDLQFACSFFESAQQAELAADLLERYVAAHQHQPGVFAAVDGPFADQLSKGLIERFRRELEQRQVRPTLPEALDRIATDEVWHPAEVSIVRQATPAEVEHLLKEVEGRHFRQRLQTLLRLGRRPDATDSDRAISLCTLDLIKKMVEVHPTFQIRLRQYIEPGDDRGAVAN